MFADDHPLHSSGTRASDVRRILNDQAQMQLIGIPTI